MNSVTQGARYSARLSPRPDHNGRAARPLILRARTIPSVPKQYRRLEGAPGQGVRERGPSECISISRHAWLAVGAAVQEVKHWKLLEAVLK